MAIVISGVNNNDKITATDGVIDLLSTVSFASTVTAPAFTASGNITAGSINVGNNIQLGNAGVATATTFVGNLTGNVNATSNLLLQIGGSEKFRVGSSGQLGIAGANYGTSGQVLTSGGSGSAATWSTINGTTINNNADNRIITGSGTANTLEGEANLTWNGQTFEAYNLSGPSYIAAKSNTNSGDYGIVQVQSGSTVRGRLVSDASVDAFRLDTAGRASAPFTFHTGSSYTERLRIKSDGKLNITPGGALSGSHPPGDFNIVGTNFLTMTPNDNANASDNEVLGHIAFLPYAAGSIAAASAKIAAVADPGQSGTSNATTLRFYNKPSSAGPGNSGIERMRINADGTVYFSENIATQSPSGQFGFRMDRGGGNSTSLHVENYANDSVNNNAEVKLITNHSNCRIIHHNQGGFYVINSGHGYLHYYSNGTSRVYIDHDGRVGINYTGTAGWAEKLNVRGTYGNGEYGIAVQITHSSGSLMRFATSSGVCGSISGSGTSTSFNTSSDYRLKENDVNITDGIARVKQLRPIRFNWKSDSSKTEDGFFAHEVSPVVPESVTGEKDAEIDEIGEGYQRMDHSKLVPLLTAALKEAITEIETLKTKVAVLESS